MDTTFMWRTYWPLTPVILWHHHFSVFHHLSHHFHWRRGTDTWSFILTKVLPTTFAMAFLMVSGLVLTCPLTPWSTPLETCHQPTCTQPSSHPTSMRRSALADWLRQPSQSTQSQAVHTSPFGLIPKKGRPNCWQLIVDLSSPAGFSVNDGIDSNHTSLHYSSIEDAVGIVQQLGPGTLMAKLNLKTAYRLVPVHPDDRTLLVTCWNGYTYLDTALPFGLASAPKIFSAVADFLLCVTHIKGACWLLHYLDDFIVFGSPSSDECLQSFLLARACCEELGWEAHKVGGPTTCLTFLPGDRNRLCKLSAQAS